MKSLREIAKELNLAPPTVSMCLSEDPGKYRLSPKTVKRVREYAEQHGYVPNRMARQLSRPASPPVGLLISGGISPDKNYNGLRQAMDELRIAGQEFIVQIIPWGKVSEVVAYLKGMRVQDIIYYGVFKDMPPSHVCRFSNDPAIKEDIARLAALLKNDMRLFAIDFEFPIKDDTLLTKNIYRWGVDRRKGMTQLFDVLKKNGKSDIMCDVSSFRLMEELVPDTRRVFRYNNIFDAYLQGHIWAEEFMAARKLLKVDMVILHNDYSCLSFIDGLRNYGLSVPGDVEVIGFDNLELCNYSNPRLTSIEVPGDGVRQALDAILHGKEVKPAHIFDMKVVWRESASISKP